MLKKTLVIILLLFSLQLIFAANSAIYIKDFRINDSLQARNSFVDLDTNKVYSIISLRELEIQFANNQAQLDDTSTDTLYYKLSCFDTNWNQTTTNNLRYTNVPKGQHLLCLKNKLTADTIILNVQNNPVLLQVAPVQDMWWFTPLLTFWLLLIPFTLAYFIFLDRSRRNLRIEVVRNQIASDLHDDVGVNLSAIKNLAEIVKLKSATSITPKQLNILSKIESYSEETLSKLQDTVWAINPLNDTVEELLDKMKSIGLTTLGAKNVSLSFDNQIQQKSISSIHLDMQQRHNMFMMYKESIHNIVKHAEASQVVVKIYNVKKVLHIQIKDDGIGFDSCKLYTGNGLKNFKQRATPNFIDVDINSIINTGTTINMKIYSVG